MSNKDLESFSKNDLVSFLRERGKAVGGLKADLLRRAKLFQHDPVLTVQQETDRDEVQRRKIFSDDSVLWHAISQEETLSIPADFNIDILSSYLTEVFLELEDDLVSCGTAKPAVKGRQLYVSGKVLLCEHAKFDGKTLFRAMMDASMRNTCR